jgi:hypothetical protein
MSFVNVASKTPKDKIQGSNLSQGVVCFPGGEPLLSADGLLILQDGRRAASSGLRYGTHFPTVPDPDMGSSIIKNIFRILESQNATFCIKV